MSKFDEEKYINYDKLSDNLKIVRDRYWCTLLRSNDASCIEVSSVYENFRLQCLQVCSTAH